MEQKTDTPSGQVEATVEQKVDLIADQIGVMLDAAEPAKAPERPAESKPPEAKEGEATEVKAGLEPPVEKPPEAPKPKVKIKWEGEEKELDQDELVNLAQKGYDYTQKTQALAEKERRLAPLEGIAKTAQSDPAFAAYLRDYFVQKGQVPKKDEQPPKFDDPIDELKYNLKKEVREEFRKELSEKEKQVAHQLVLQRVRNEARMDPDFPDVTKLMIEHLKTLPEETGKLVFLQWDQNPDAYQKAFSHYKTVVRALKDKTPAPAAWGAPSQTPPATQTPAERTTKAPLLEASGTGEQGTAVTERAKKISRMKAKALRSGDPSAIADWLLESGSIDNIIK